MPDPNRSIPLRNLRSQQRANIGLDAADLDNDDDRRTKPFRLRDVHIDMNNIFRILKDQTIPWAVMGQNMPPITFDDLGPYGIGKEEEMILWEFEVKRLVKAATSVDPPSLEGSPEWYGQADAEGYEFLHNFAGQLYLAGNICFYDADQQMLKFVPGLVTSNEKNNIRIRQDYMTREKMGKKDRLGQQHGRAYHALVNYITAIFARIFIRCIENDEWAKNGLSTLAKLTSKLKVVGTDIDQAFSTSAGRNILEPTSPESDVRGEEQLYNNHLRVTKEYYTRIRNLFESVALDLLCGKTEQNLQYDCFETSAVVYDAGFRGSRAQIWQLRRGTIGTSGYHHHVQVASIAFDVCRDIWETLPDNGHESALHWTTVDWSWTETSNIRHEADILSRRRILTDMKSVLATLVPYSMLKGSFSSYLSGCMVPVDSTTSFQFYESPIFLSAVRIRTTQYERTTMTRKKRNQIYQNLYDTPLAKERGLIRLMDGDGGHDVEYSSGSMAQKIHQYRETNEKYHRGLQEVNSWVIDKRAIVITNVWYSYAVLAAIGVFALSGIALIALGQHVSGVDPSNLTMLAWTAASVLVIYFKSIRVENWPWRDFLRGRVVCRSVSEVVAVTKMDAQTLLAVLMHHEESMSLMKAGPFNTFFQRVNDDGFAIDVPPLTETAMAGGYIFVCARGYDGMLLVGIMFNRMTMHMCVNPYESVPEDAAICTEPLAPGRYRMQLGKGRGNSRKEVDSEYLPLHSLRRGSSKVREVLGIYTEEACLGGVGGGMG